MMHHSRIGSTKDRHPSIRLARGDRGLRTCSHLVFMTRSCLVAVRDLPSREPERERFPAPLLAACQRGIDIAADVLRLLVDLVGHVEFVSDLGRSIERREPVALFEYLLAFRHVDEMGAL